MRLVFASNNAHKLEEIRAIMPAGIEVLSLHDIGFEQEIEETGLTLAENSKIKAETVYHWLSDNGYSTVDGVFADDTGLEIDALGGEPGVFTARWYRLNDGMSAAAPLNDERMIYYDDDFDKEKCYNFSRAGAHAQIKARRGDFNSLRQE